MSETTAQSAATGIEEMLAEARARLRRLTPQAAAAALDRGAVLVDIRGDAQRARDGVIPGARVVSRNTLEWRTDPRCPDRDPAIARPDAHIVLICDQGYQSSLAAATLQRLGLPLATDVIGGFQAWRAAGLPVSRTEARYPGRYSASRTPDAAVSAAATQPMSRQSR